MDYFGLFYNGFIFILLFILAWDFFWLGSNTNEEIHLYDVAVSLMAKAFVVFCFITARVLIFI